TAGLVVEEEAPRPRPDRPEEVEETPIETEEVDDHNEVDTDSDFEESAGDAGMRDSPFVGPSTNAAIGIGGGAGGAGSVFRSRALGKGPVLHSVQDALRWIASQQRVDGSWGSVEATARALLPYLGSGFTDRGSARDNPYARTVRMGIRYLMNRQTKEGRFHKDDRVHALAAAVMAESYALTRNPRYKKPAQRALNALSLARAQYGAWPRDKADDRTTVVAVLALKAGKAAGLAIDPDSFEGARQHLRKSKRIDALWAREMLGELGAVKAGLKNLTLIVDKADSWDDVGVFLVGGEHWVNWRRARMEHLRKVQRRDGSWGGDVSKTADACLSLLTAQRYRPR
ncbi:MAG: prenyltransferase/squalene oxidase repeat-containing protein, partial [Planctomycetota bacterium]